MPSETASCGGGEGRPFVGRGGLKLQHALEQFRLVVRGRVCADLGANVGGFTDCLLRAGASAVYAVDTAYGVLDYRLRTDPRVIVMERTNVLHADPPGETDKPSVLVMDLGWTPQRLAVPAALRWLARTEDARVVSLIKPQYEAERKDARRAPGILEDDNAERIAQETAERMPEWGARSLALIRSPIRGGATRGVKQGNLEWLALLERYGD